MSSRIFKQARLHASPYIVGDEKLAQIARSSPEVLSGKMIDLNKVEEQIEQIMATAAANAERLEKEAAERGREQGIAAAEEEAGRILAEARAEAERIVREAGAEAERLRADVEREKEAALVRLEPEVVELVLKVARKVIRTQVDERGREVVLNLVREGLRRVDDRDEVRVRVNPVDFAVVQENRENLMAVMESAGSVVVEQDRRVVPGNCLIETSYGTIDASIDIQMDAVEKAFRELLARRDPA